MPTREHLTKYMREYRAKYREKHLAIVRNRPKTELSRKYRASVKGKYNQIKQSAEKRGLAFELTLEQYQKFIGIPCFYCNGVVASAGLDRVNNDMGYLIDNVVSCCFTCNRMKLTHAQADFLEYVRRIAIHHNLM